ncbi:MAG: hypothetical protein P8Z37_07300 [Acidobacteriota bacterium]
MDKNRILELAIESLERQKAELDEEIQNIKAQMKGQAAGSVKRKKAPAKPKKKQSMTPAQRKVRSERMKKYWAEKKAAASKK